MPVPGQRTPGKPAGGGGGYPANGLGGAGGESRETPAGPHTLPALGWMELQYPATPPYLSLLSTSHTHTPP